MKKIVGVFAIALLGACLGFILGRENLENCVAESAAGDVRVSSPRQRHEKMVDSGRFDWSQVQNDEVAQYIANLRAIGCPEPTIGDIIRAHIFAMYQARVNRIFDPLARNWTTAADAKAVEREIKDIRRERDQLLAELKLETSEFDRASVLPPEKQRRVAEAISRFPVVRLDSATVTEDDLTRQAAARKARITYLSQFLTAEELLDYRIAHDGNSVLIRALLAGINPSEEEFRKVFSLLDGETLTRSNGYLSPDLEAKLGQLLGEDRYAQYRQDHEAMNPLLRSWARANGLTDDQVRQLLVLRSAIASMEPKQYQAEVGRIIQNPAKAIAYINHPMLHRPPVSAGAPFK